MRRLLRRQRQPCRLRRHARAVPKERQPPGRPPLRRPVPAHGGLVRHRHPGLQRNRPPPTPQPEHGLHRHPTRASIRLRNPRLLPPGNQQPPLSPPDPPVARRHRRQSPPLRQRLGIQFALRPLRQRRRRQPARPPAHLPRQQNQHPGNPPRLRPPAPPRRPRRRRLLPPPPSPRRPRRPPLS